MAVRKINTEFGEFEISYEIYNPNASKNIIFLHGWGANKEIMKIFKDDFFEFRQLYVDLPGFGKSSNDYVLTTKDYAKIIDIFLNELNFPKEIIIGHSFGGKIATLLNPDLLVLLASSGILMPKPLSVRIKISIYKAFKFLGMAKFRNFFVSDDVKGMKENMYLTFKNVVDEDFSENFKNYKGKALIFGGEKDSAVPKKAIEMQANLLKSNFIMLSGGHYFFFNEKDSKKNREIIRKEILKAINFSQKD